MRFRVAKVYPSTYSEWVVVLDRFKSKENDEETLKVMQSGTITWQIGVAERFSNKLVDAVNCRLDKATSKFQSELKHSNGEERAIVQALISLRRELSFLAKAVDIQAIPDSYRQQYYQLVVNQANSIQKSLEDSAKKDRSGKLSSIIRNNRVNLFVEEGC